MKDAIITVYHGQDETNYEYLSKLVWQELFNEYRLNNGSLDDLYDLLCDLNTVQKWIQDGTQRLWWTFDGSLTTISDSTIYGPNVYIITNDKDNNRFVIENQTLKKKTMDPQACFRRIMNVIECPNDYDSIESAWDELNEAMSNLWKWLSEGGFPPIVDSLGIAEYNYLKIDFNNNEYYVRQTIKNKDGTLAIQTKKPDERGWFEMVKYNHIGQKIARFDLG